MSNFCNVALKKKKYTNKDGGSFTNLIKHLLRHHKAEYKKADGTHKENNEVLIGESEPFTSEYLYEFLKDNNLKIRNSRSILAYQLVFSIPSELKGDAEKIELFKKQTMDFLNTDEKFKGNVLLAVYHGDETQPHIQAVCVPRKGTKLAFQEMFGGPEGGIKLSTLQDQFGACMAPLGLVRGDGTHTNDIEFKDYMQGVRKMAEPVPDVPQVPEVQQTWNLLANVENLKKQNSVLKEQNKTLREFSKIRKANILEKQNRKLRVANDKLKKKTRELKDFKMRLTNEKLEKLRQIDCREVLKALGIHYKTEGTTTRYKDTEKNINLVINEDGKFTENKSLTYGGGAVDLLVKVFNFKFKDATTFLAEKFGFDRTAKVIAAEPEHVEKTVKEALKKEVLQPPLPNPKNISKVRKYLIEERKLNSEIVDALIKMNRIYADDKNNCVFTNSENTMAFLRGTYKSPDPNKKPFKAVRGEIDFIKYNFGSDKSNEVYLFESTIEALSFRSLYPEKQGLFVALNGSAMINKVHELGIDKFSKVNCCFNNDAQGKIFDAKISEQTTAKVEFIKPLGKDFNEDLVNGKSGTTTEFRNLKTPK